MSMYIPVLVSVRFGRTVAFTLANDPGPLLYPKVVYGLSSSAMLSGFPFLESSARPGRKVYMYKVAAKAANELALRKIAMSVLDHQGNLLSLSRRKSEQTK